MDSNLFFEIKKIKAEIKYEKSKKRIIEELEILENTIKNLTDHDDIQNLLIIYTKYIMKILSIINSFEDILLEKLLFKKLNSFLNWKKTNITTSLKMQEIIDNHFIDLVK